MSIPTLVLSGVIATALLCGAAVVGRSMDSSADTSAAGRLKEGWEELSRLKPEPALRAFGAAGPSNVAEEHRESELGRATALLAKQPVTAPQVEEARAICARLAESNSDEYAQAGRYFLGRIAQHHQETPDIATAATEYRRLIGAFPKSVWADVARTRLAILELYAPPFDGPSEPKIAAGEELLRGAVLPVAQSELHLVLSDAIFYYGLPAARALPHLKAAESLGLLDGPARADVLIQIAEVSLLGGDSVSAKAYYEKYLTEFPLDQRRYMVKQKLLGVK